MFEKPALTIFAPLFEHPREAEETRLLLEERLNEQFIQLPAHNITDPFWLKPGEECETIKLLHRFNPRKQKLHIVAGSNENHQSTYFFVKYFASQLDNLVYVHIDQHPDAALLPNYWIAPGSLEYIHDGRPDKTFGLGTFVHHIADLPSASSLVMLGYMRSWHNNYSPSITYDCVRGPEGIAEYEKFVELFGGKNVYVSIDADALAGWAGFMMGGQMVYQELQRNLEGIAAVGNIVCIDMTGFCKTKQEFEEYRIDNAYGVDKEQFEITRLTFELTRKALNS